MYTVDYFVAKFQAIPEERWCIGAFTDRHGRSCANGHCGVNNFHYGSREGESLAKVFDLLKDIHKCVNRSAIDRSFKNADWSFRAAHINDGECVEYQQSTPKQRILAALMDIKKMQQPEITDPPIYVENLIRTKQQQTIEHEPIEW